MRLRLRQVPQRALIIRFCDQKLAIIFTLPGKETIRPNPVWELTALPQTPN